MIEFTWYWHGVYLVRHSDMIVYMTLSLDVIESRWTPKSAISSPFQIAISSFFFFFFGNPDVHLRFCKPPLLSTL